MKRATTVGLATGVILSLLFIGAGLLRNSLTVTTLTQQWFFLGVFVILVVSTLWVANNYVCKSGTAQLGAMSICGISSTLVASFIFSVVSFIYTQYIDSSYLPNLMAQSQSLWDEKQYSQASIAGQLEWQWFKSPYSFAISNFQFIRGGKECHVQRIVIQGIDKASLFNDQVIQTMFPGFQCTGYAYWSTTNDNYIVDYFHDASKIGVIANLIGLRSLNEKLTGLFIMCQLSFLEK